MRKIALFIGFFALCIQSYAQNAAGPVILGMSDAGAFSILERSDWRRYDNGRYVGLTRNEVRASIIPQAAYDNTGDSTFYHGNFFVIQSTLRDMRQSAQAVDAIIPVSFEVMRSGSITIENDQGFPMMRGFPSFPSQGVTLGVKWQAPGYRAVDPLNTGQAVVIPFTAEYEYRGIESYRDTPVHRIFAMYGYNYPNRVAPHPYARVTGSHRVDILIRVADGLPVFMRDQLNVAYTLSDGSTTEFRGFTLTFGSGIVLMDRGSVVASLENALRIVKPVAPAVPVLPEPVPVPQVVAGPVIQGPSEAEDQARRPPPAINAAGLQDSAIDLTPVPEGIRLTIRDIRFMPDSPEFLASERPRLDLIADALKQIPDRTFLVEGHTASTGRPSSEMQLSIERANSLINELVRRGISADRFVYKGWGGTRPVGDNATDSGRSANRRVEITILE